MNQRNTPTDITYSPDAGDPLLSLPASSSRVDPFRLAIEASPTGMVLIDREGRIVMVNAALEKLFGYCREELIAQPVEVLVPERLRREYSEARAVLLGERQPRLTGSRTETFGLRKDRVEVPIEIGLNPMRTHEGSFVLSSIVDIAERKRAEQERETLFRQLQSLNAELEMRVNARTRELSATLQEREILLQEIHHRVKNNLQVISSLIKMQMRKLNPGPTRDALEECQTRVQAISLIHEQLYQSKDYARVPFSDYVRNLAGNILNVMGATTGSILLDLVVEDIPLAVDRAIPCGLIVNELLTNAVKHAFPAGRRGTVRVELGRVGPSHVRLVVSDDGVGLPASVDLDRAGSLGLQLVRTLTKQLDGELSVSPRPGASFQVIFRAA